MGKPPDSLINLCLLVTAFTDIVFTEEIHELMFWKLEQTVLAMPCKPMDQACNVYHFRVCNVLIAFIIYGAAALHN